MGKIIIGFTGTRHGMSESQKEQFIKELNNYKNIDFLHGDCVGADAEAHEIVSNISGSYIIIHPPVDEKHRAFCEGFSEKLPQLTHFARNRKIVDSCDLLIAAPLQDEPQQYGGTWYTIKYAQKKKKNVIILNR